MPSPGSKVQSGDTDGRISGKFRGYFLNRGFLGTKLTEGSLTSVLRTGPGSLTSVLRTGPGSLTSGPVVPNLCIKDRSIHVSLFS